MPAQLDIDNPHRMDPARFNRAFRYYLADRLDVTILPADVGLTGVCRECGYDDGQPPIRFRAETDEAAQYVAVARVRAAIDAGWDGVSGCWARHRAVRALYAHLRHQGAPTPAPRLHVVTRPATPPQETTMTIPDDPRIRPHLRAALEQIHGALGAKVKIIAAAEVRAHAAAKTAADPAAVPEVDHLQVIVELGAIIPLNMADDHGPQPELLDAARAVSIAAALDQTAGLAQSIAHPLVHRFHAVLDQIRSAS